MAFLLGVIGVLGAASQTLVPVTLGRAVDGVLGHGSTSMWTAAFVGLVAVGIAADVLTEWCTGVSVARRTALWRRSLVGHILRLGPTLRLPSGDVSGRVVSATAEAGLSPSALIAAGAAALPPLGALVALVLLDPWLAVALVVGLPFIIVLLRVFVRDTSAVLTRYLAAQGTMAGLLVEALAGGRTIAAAGTADREIERILAPLPELSREGHATWRVQAGMASRGSLAVPLLQVAVLAVAGIEVTHGRLTAGGLLAAVQYAGLGADVGPVIAQLGRGARARAGVRRIGELLALPVRRFGQAKTPEGPGRLEFHGVRAGSVLEQVDLVVPEGQAVAIVGRSGSGKSLLASLAGRLAEPDEGEILLDGVPLRELDRDALRAAFAFAFERPVLFGPTIADSIAPGGHGDVVMAGVAGRADGFVRKLPRGYETPLEEAPMSGGERQRIGLARAFAQESRVLVLDDATSSLDTVTEMQISQVIFGLGGRTRLVVAHRAATAARADLVAWLDGGRIRAVGPHRVLWADPDYRAVFQAAEQVGRQGES